MESGYSWVMDQLLPSPTAQSRTAQSPTALLTTALLTTALLTTALLITTVHCLVHSFNFSLEENDISAPTKQDCLVHPFTFL